MVFLWTDVLVYLLILGILGITILSFRYEYLRAPWRKVASRPLAVASAIILCFYIIVAVLDSIHYKSESPHQATSQQALYSNKIRSFLDYLLSPLGQESELSYSAPFAKTAYSKISQIDSSGNLSRVYPKLKYITVNNSTTQKAQIAQIIFKASIKTLLIWAFIVVATLLFLSYRHKKNIFLSVLRGKTLIAWRSIFISFGILLWLTWVAISLSEYYHILGTDKVGEDIFYQAIKSIRTGLIIGSLTTLITLPFAILLGMMAGYFRGWVDDVIQYLYTTLSSIPGVLLIAAAILSLQVFISNHPQLFSTMTERADARLLALCFILGITSWTSLCRVLRAETLKLREMDYISAAKVLGTSQFKILLRHIFPNLMHIVVITIVLDFSMLVLAEAVLSYVGVGVDPITMSWGNMINGARLELAREPIVWWPLLAAFLFMFSLVLSANLFADAVRDAFDPRTAHH